MQDVGCFQVPHPQEWLKAPRRPKDPWCKLIKRNRSSFLTTWPWETPRYSQSLARVQFSPPPFIKAHSQLDTPFPTQTMAEICQKKKNCFWTSKRLSSWMQIHTSTNFNRLQPTWIFGTSIHFSTTMGLGTSTWSGQDFSRCKRLRLLKTASRSKEDWKKNVFGWQVLTWITKTRLKNKTQIQNDILWHS